MNRLRLALMIVAVAGPVQSAPKAATPKPQATEPRSVGAESLGVSAEPVRSETPAATRAPPPPAAKAVTAKAPAGKPGPFDARDPASLVAFLKTTGATAEVAASRPDKVALAVTTPGGVFAAQYVDCDAKGKACKALAFTSIFERRQASLGDINAFNRTQVLCRGYLGTDGRPSVAYSTLVNLRMTTDEMRLHISAWQGCLASFGEFTRDPTGYLARNR